MATILQLRRGTTVQHSTFTGAEGEVTVNTTKDTLVVHDGAVAGGYEIVSIAATQTLTNKTLTSPTLTTPALGTPASGVLTSCTGLPVSTGITGLGTGVATALAVNTGSAGAFVTFNGALGTPSAGTLTNATGLPISSGVSGLGTGVATFLGTPSSANLISAITDETGSGALVFGTSPAITTSITTPSTTFALVNTTATTVNFAGAATTVSIGAATGTATINNAEVVISGNLTVNGTTTTVNSTTITVDDKNLELGSVAVPSNTTADGGGITLKGATDKTFNWVNSSSAWTSSEHIALAAGKTLVVGGSSSGTTTVTASAAASGTLTLPAATDTLVGKATTDTLTNKSISLTNNTVTFTSLELKTACSDETGSGALVFATSPTLVTPTLGVASATSVNKVAITAPATGSTLTIADGKTLTASNSLTFTGTDATSFAFPGTSDTVVTLTATQTLTNKTLTSPTMTTPTLGVASATSVNKVAITAPATGSTLTLVEGSTLATSGAFSTTLTATAATNVTLPTTGTLATLAGSETFTNKTLTSPTLTTPALGTPSSGTLTSCTGLPISTGVSGLGTNVATFLATPSSANLAAALTDETGSGANVFATSPTLVTPTLGVASATSVNKVAITAPATGSTLTIADGKTLTASNTLTFTGTDASSVAFGAGGTVAYTANKLSAFAATTSTELAGVISDETGSGALVFGTSPALTTPTLNSSVVNNNNAVSAAGTTQGTATALTVDYNVITTAAASSGVVLPTATAGRRIVIVNKGANTLSIYPATGGTIDALAANAAIQVAANGSIELMASSTTQWYSIARVAIYDSAGTLLN